MASDLDFYFDFSSPYGYFASMRIDALASTYQRAVKWRPILLGVVFKSSGALPLTMIPMKGAYSLRDMERTARLHGIAYRHPAPFPIATQVAARAMLWLRNAGDSEAIAFAKAAYRAYFVDGIDISDVKAVAQIAADLGHDATALAAGIDSPAIKEQLKGEIEQAMRRGVFGSPFIIADEEPFWGFDRFGQLETLLKNGAI